MDWTAGTFLTMGKDVMDTWDRLWTAWTPGTAWRPLLIFGRLLRGDVRVARCVWWGMFVRFARQVEV